MSFTRAHLKGLDKILSNSVANRDVEAIDFYAASTASASASASIL